MAVEDSAGTAEDVALHKNRRPRPSFRTEGGVAPKVRAGHTSTAEVVEGAALASGVALSNETFRPESPSCPASPQAFRMQLLSSAHQEVLRPVCHSPGIPLSQTSAASGKVGGRLQMFWKKWREYFPNSVIWKQIREGVSWTFIDDPLLSPHTLFISPFPRTSFSTFMQRQKDFWRKGR